MTDIKIQSPTTIIADDYDRLVELVELTKDVMPEISFCLKQELDRATIVTDADPASVQMGSMVRFRDDATATVRDIQLVYPVDSDLGDGRLSVLTPVGSALLGQQAGTTASCRDRAGRTRSLTVVAVQPPHATSDR
ncbi:MAG TPA: GreA/GreB family elongation factor [Rhizomicrobium sp.]|nr:GreA/GreB family elongation factor [Rhizomicrobium sp.]